MAIQNETSILNDIYEVIKLKQLDYKFDGKKANIQLKVCPVCGDENYHLYLGITHENLGLWNCFKCGGRSTTVTEEHNNWNKLRKLLLGDQNIVITPVFRRRTETKNNYVDQINACHKELFGDQEALTWLIKERNISVESIKFYKLGLRTMQPPDYKEPTKFLCIPHFYRNNLANAKFRAIPPAKKGFVRLPNAESILFNYDNIDHSKDYIYVCEGELDAISLYQVGETNIVSITVGARAFMPEWYDLLREFRIVYIVLDNDRYGQEGARIIAERLGRDRCYNIMLPKNGGIKDLNDYFKEYDINDFKGLTLKANKFTIDTIYTLDAIFTDMEGRLQENGVLIEGYDTPWETLNDKMGIIARGDLVYLSGKPKTLKTSLALNLCYYYAYEKKIPCLLFCLEMLPIRLASKLICRHRMVDAHMLAAEDIYMCRADFVYNEIPLYFGYTADPKYLKMESIFKIFELARRKYGIEFLVFDNLQFLSRSLVNTPQEIAMISRQFKLLAMNLDMRVMVIVQPKRIADDQVMTSAHMKDSSAMEADADIVLINHRKSRAPDLVKRNFVNDETVLSNIVTVTVDRSRYAPGGYVKFHIDGAKSYLKEATDDEISAE